MINKTKARINNLFVGIHKFVQYKLACVIVQKNNKNNAVKLIYIYILLD